MTPRGGAHRQGASSLRDRVLRALGSRRVARGRDRPIRLEKIFIQNLRRESGQNLRRGSETEPRVARVVHAARSVAKQLGTNVSGRSTGRGLCVPSPLDARVLA